LLSLFVGLSVLVPYIGATVMFLPVGFIAFFQWGLNSDFFYIMIAYSIIQALDGNLLVPLLLSGVVNLHPVAIIVAVLLFGGLWGILGLFFAIPLATLVHAVVKALVNTYSLDRQRVPDKKSAA
jgi:putative permease